MRVDRVGPLSARTRLVLLPGGYAGAGEIKLLARNLARRRKGLQVWIVANRYQNLEDRRFLDSGTALRRLVRMSRIGSHTYVNASSRTSHLDPPVDLPSKNLLRKPLARFLKRGPRLAR